MEMLSMTGKRLALSEDCDIRLLKFLWRWKFSTTAALAQKFFWAKPIGTAYNHLRRLEKAGFIACRCDEWGQNFYWMLTRRGLLVIQRELPPLREVGFKSEHIAHDALVNAVHLGDWLLETPPNVKLFSEQQLRRLSFEEYPAWVPKSPDHRPDGYWGLPLKQSTRPIAIEVELHQKEKSIYEDLAKFYEDEEAILSVIWLVPSMKHADRLQSVIRKSVSKRADIHNFLLLPEFQSHCWESVIYLGPERNQTLAGYLDAFHKTTYKKPVKSLSKLTRHPLLETRKSYVASRHSTKPPVNSNSN